MLLRSSSTPVLSSLLSSHPESPGPGHGHGHQEAIGKHLQPAAFGHHHHKLPFHGTTFYCTISSPVIDSTSKGFRRAQSEGNLEELVASAMTGDDQFCDNSQARKFGASRPRSGVMLETIPSFSFYGLRARFEDDEEESEADDGEDDRDDFEDSIVIKPSMALQGSLTDVGNDIGLNSFDGGEMFHTKGLGIAIDQDGGCNGCGGGSRSCQVDYGGDGRENNGIEEYYKRMVDENPSNALFLRNYAQFLHQTKGETERADEYYSRAILADPNDGELLSQYANLVWELHQDKERALSYFQRAAQASPEDSHVHTAYAGFLWETEDEDGDDEASKESSDTMTQLRQGLLSSLGS